MGYIVRFYFLGMFGKLISEVCRFVVGFLHPYVWTDSRVEACFIGGSDEFDVFLRGQLTERDETSEIEFVGLDVFHYGN